MKNKNIERKHNISLKFNQNDKSIIQNNIKIVYGKEILKPIESIPPVSQTIEKYIRDRFATTN